MSKLTNLNNVRLNLRAVSVACMWIVLLNVYTQIDESSLVNRPMHFIECIGTSIGGDTFEQFPKQN